MLKLVRNRDGSFDLITAKGVVLLHEESYQLCANVQAYLDGTDDQIPTRGYAYDEAREVAAQLRGDELA